MITKLASNFSEILYRIAKYESDYQMHSLTYRKFCNCRPATPKTASIQQLRARRQFPFR